MTLESLQKQNQLQLHRLSKFSLCFDISKALIGFCGNTFQTLKCAPDLHRHSLRIVVLTCIWPHLLSMELSQCQALLPHSTAGTLQSAFPDALLTLKIRQQHLHKLSCSLTHRQVFIPCYDRNKILKLVLVITWQCHVKNSLSCKFLACFSLHNTLVNEII